MTTEKRWRFAGWFFPGTVSWGSASWLYGGSVTGSTWWTWSNKLNCEVESLCIFGFCWEKPL